MRLIAKDNKLIIEESLESQRDNTNSGNSDQKSDYTVELGKGSVLNLVRNKKSGNRQQLEWIRSNRNLGGYSHRNGKESDMVPVNNG